MNADEPLGDRRGAATASGRRWSLGPVDCAVRVVALAAWFVLVLVTVGVLRVARSSDTVVHLWWGGVRWVAVAFGVAAVATLCCLVVQTIAATRRRPAGGRRVLGALSSAVAVALVAVAVAVTGMVLLLASALGDGDRITFRGSDGSDYLMVHDGSESTHLAVYRRTGVVTYTLVPGLGVHAPAWPCTGTADARRVVIRCADGATRTAPI